MTTRSRFITYIQNWPVKPVALLFVWILLLFFSCKDDAALVGFRKDPKLSTNFIEIPLASSMFLRSPVSTKNTVEEPLARILIGKYNDPDFGDMEARGYFTFSPPIVPVTPENTAVFESLALQLKFDYYAYGSFDSSDLRLQVFELLDVIGSDGEFYNTTIPSVSTVPIGDIIIAPGPIELKNGWDLYVDADPTNNMYFTLLIPLSGALGQSLFDDVANNPAILEDFSEFITKYPGLSVAMASGNKILGATPVFSLPVPNVIDSKLILTYKDGFNTSSIDFPIYFNSNSQNDFIPVVSFSSITTDRSTSSLNGILPFMDFVPTDKKLYVQSGSGVLSKIDLGNFYSFADTLDNMVINSAEIILNNTSSARPPQGIHLRILDSQNQFRPITFDTIIGGFPIRVNDPYLVQIRSGIEAQGSASDLPSVGIINQITGSVVNINPETGKIGSTILTEFFQQIYDTRAHPRRVEAFSIFPLDDEFEKTVSSLVLDPASATLRLYYSKPTITEQ